VAGDVNVGGAVLVAVEVAVEVAVDVTVGLGWVVSAGVGKSGGEGTAECDERFTWLGETDAGAAGGGAVLAGDVVLAGDAVLTGDSSGDTPLGTPVSPATGALPSPMRIPRRPRPSAGNAIR
jgi:hypothetical protein